MNPAGKDSTLVRPNNPLTEQLVTLVDAENRHPVLIHLLGPHQGRRIKLLELQTTLGRSREADIRIDDPSCSRLHALLNYRNHDSPDQAPDVSLRDLGSSNGTFLNGERIEEAPLKDHDKLVLGNTMFGFFLRDMWEAQAEERLWYMANMDSLTGLYNRRYFNAEIRKELNRAVRYRHPIALMLIDIDFFKKVNDTYGHNAGDLVLREIGRRIRTSVRLTDIAARFGGEEFAVILPETDLQGALNLAQRLRIEIARQSFQYQEQTLEVTASIGVAAAESFTCCMDQLIQAADHQLYRAKNNGRNQVAAAFPNRRESA